MYFAPLTSLTFADQSVPNGTRLVGYAALVCALEVQAPVRSLSCVSNKYVKGNTRIKGNWKVFDKRYWPSDTLGDHLTFALKHEPLGLLVLKRVLARADPKEIKAFVFLAPTGAAHRRGWFFYETLTGQKLDVPDAGSGPAVDALNSKLYSTAKPILSKRHRVRDNLLGDSRYCPLIRRTETLELFLKQELSNTASDTAGRTDRRLLARATSFMLLAVRQVLKLRANVLHALALSGGKAVSLSVGSMSSIMVTKSRVCGGRMPRNLEVGI